MKLPSFQFYPGDWIRDNVAGCSLAAQGLWLRMMILMHDSDRYGYLSTNGSPIPPESIARRCGCTPEQYETLLAELDRFSVPSRTPEGIIFSRRMVRDAQERARNAEYQKNQRKAEVPKSAKTLRRHAPVMPLSDPSSHTSSSSSTSPSSSDTHSPPATNGHKVESVVGVTKPSDFTFDEICEYLEAHPKGIDSIEAVAGAALKDGRLDKRIRKWRAGQANEAPPAESPPQEVVSDAEMEALVRDCVSSGMRSVIETLVRDIQGRGGPQKQWEREAVAALESSDSGLRTSDSKDQLTARA